MKILAIETSCDETAAAIVERQDERLKTITNVISSQIKSHTPHGGVIPNLAARLHTANLPLVLDQATDRGQIEYDAVAVTRGPGLIGCLLLGITAAKTLSASQGKPIFAVNHLEGHIYSVFLVDQEVELPALFVIVSGGHTELVLMRRHLQYQLLGATRDDAAGEAFDKVARLLGLGYPGGPEISKLARSGDRHAFTFPIGLRQRDSLEFSFSGLKAAVAEKVKNLGQPLSAHLKADLAASFEETVVQTIVRKTVAAFELYPEIETVGLVGGVATNQHLRVGLTHAINDKKPNCQIVIPPPEYCTDNAAMIGAAAAFRSLFVRPDNWYDIEADPGLELSYVSR